MSETEDNVQICDPVLLNSFVIKNKRCRVYFHRGKLIWETDGSPYNRYTLLLADVIAVDYVHSTDKTLCCPSESQGYNQEESKIAGDSNPGLSQRHTSFIIHYGVRGRNNNKWRHHTVTMNHTDPRQIASWVKTIHNYINSFTKRPKRIMVFVNPYGGKKKGLQIYEKRVMPLFELAGVHTTITITQSANHARDTLLSCSFDNIDAITCVGGDGTFAEVFNGLVLRTAKDKGIDQNDPEAILPTPSLRVGIIPAGSTDTMAYCFHGTTDVQTAVLLIIFGDSVGLDLCSVHSNATLLRYYSSVISYGYLGDVVRDSERFRWMGPKRYDYSELTTVTFAYLVLCNGSCRLAAVGRYLSQHLQHMLFIRCVAILHPFMALVLFELSPENAVPNGETHSCSVVVCQESEQNTAVPQIQLGCQIFP
uniref:DAGKc domain-containing protein n=1 Tax=Timema shepardi TaxID=629360 RepID=A0A7R9FYL6_TIMSH|nr:unnamed protein product [Timema shepardi]